MAIEALGAAAWHLGIPAPEQSRQLLLALTKIKAIIKAAQCAAVVSIPAGDYGNGLHSVLFFRGVMHRQCCFAGYVHAVMTVRKQEQQGVDIINKVRYWQGALKWSADIQVS